MKRLYLVLGLIFIFFTLALTAFGQMSSGAKDKESESFKRRMQLREELHKRMRDHLLLGMGQDQDMFKDLEQMMEEALSDSMSQIDQIGGGLSTFKMEWSESQSGRTLVVTPQSPEQKINIDVNATMITIKSESQAKSQHSVSSSAMSNSFPVPDDCDGTKVKMDHKDSKFLLVFPFKTVKSIQRPVKEERKPLPPSDQDVQI
jgi:hypothetical protein